jgi:hypothetical protein
MKKYIFEHTLGPLIEQYHPRVLVETGTHRGRSSCYMVQQSLQYHDDVEFHGFDLFETATAETDAREINGKGHGSYKKAQARLQAIQQQHPGFRFTLYRGFTTETFTTPIRADLAYIDGGHSTETVLHDLSMVRDSAVIVFDDYQMDSVKEALRIAGIADRVEPFITKKTHQAIFINS